MKIAVMNYSGNVGKTTLARDLLHFNLQDHDLLTIESVNSDGKEQMIIRGNDGDKIYTELLVTDNLILDIGSSNLEDYLNNSERESEFISSIDLFIIPVTPEKKQQADTLKTIRDIIELGASRNIEIIFNQVNDDYEVKEVFSDLISSLDKMSIKVNVENYIFRHDLYSRGQQLSELINDEDYRLLMEEAKKIGDDINARKFALKYIQQKKVNALNDCYTKIFNNITKGIL